MTSKTYKTCKTRKTYRTSKTYKTSKTWPTEYTTGYRTQYSHHPQHTEKIAESAIFVTFSPSVDINWLLGHDQNWLFSFPVNLLMVLGFQFCIYAHSSPSPSFDARAITHDGHGRSKRGRHHWDFLFVGWLWRRHGCPLLL